MREKRIDLLDLLLLLATHKKLLLWHFLFIALGSVAYSVFVLDKVYKSTVTFLPPTLGSSSGLSALMQNFSVDILGSNDISKQQIQVILDSREIIEAMVRKYDLIHVYETEDSPKYLEKAIEIFAQNRIVEIQEAGGLGFSDITSVRVSLFDTDSNRVATMVNDYIDMVDKRIQGLNIFRATTNKEFIQGQIERFEDSLGRSQERLKDFQIANKVFNPSEQIRQVLQSVAMLKSQIVSLETQRSLALNQRSRNHPAIVGVNQQISVLENKIKEIEENQDVDILLGLNRSIELGHRYAKLLMDVEANVGVLTLLKQQFEQAKIQEQKHIPFIRVLDPGRVPQYKSKPKRAFVVLGITFVYMSIVVCFILVKSYVSRNPEARAVNKAREMLTELKRWR